MSNKPTIHLPTRELNPEMLSVLESLKVGDRIEVIQTVRVGSRKWTSVTQGAYRDINYLATGVTTDRVPEDDIVMPMLHYIKDNGELTSIALDENSQIRVV